MYDRPVSVNADARCPTNTGWAPGFPPPAFTYSPVPLTYSKVFAGIEEGDTVEAVSRAPLTNTWSGAQPTDEARYTLPDTGDQFGVPVRSSAPSIRTGAPCACRV